MSHYGLLVVTDRRPDERELEILMAPYYEEEGNDNCKWDWYQIGGRWTGHLDPDYDPDFDARNIETCTICNGTGMRTDNVGNDIRSKDPNYKCNGCDGNGKRTKWPTQWAKFDGDQVQVKDLKPNADLNFFAYLVDGQWYEKGEMGWFGIVLDEKNPDQWKEQQNKIRAALKPEQWLTVVDVHI